MIEDAPRLLVLWIMLLCATAQASTEFQDPLDTPAQQRTTLIRRPVIGITSAGDRLVAVGPRGLIIVSGDEGKTWAQSKVPVQTDLVAVDFATPKEGWAVGHSGLILHSKDGGDTWVKQLDGRAEAKEFTQYYQKQVKDDSRGSADESPVGAKFADGGSTVKGGAGNKKLSAKKTDPEKSSDKKIAAALKLTQLNFSHGPGLPYLAVSFQNTKKGIVVGAFGKIAATSDGGRTWEPWLSRIDNSRDGLSLYDIRNINGGIYIAGERGHVFTFNRDKKTFSGVNTGYRGAFFGVTGNDHVLLAYGVSGAVYRSKDQGKTWKKVQTPVQVSISAGTRRRDNHGFVFVTHDGELLLCNGSGEQFQVIDAKRPMPFTGVVSLDDGTVVLTGLGGVERQTLPAVSE